MVGPVLYALGRPFLELAGLFGNGPTFMGGAAFTIGSGLYVQERNLWSGAAFMVLGRPLWSGLAFMVEAGLYGRAPGLYGRLLHECNLRVAAAFYYSGADFVVAEQSMSLRLHGVRCE